MSYPNSSTERILVVDADNLVCRAFYAIPAMFSPDGSPTNALRGFSNMVLNLKKQTGATQVIAAFDGGIPETRRLAAPSYKANRTEKPEDLSAQLESCRTLICPALNVSTLHAPQIEADDLLFTIAVRCSERAIPCAIASGDKDTAQCLQLPFTTLLRPPKQAADPWGEIQQDQVKDVFGVGAEAIPDYLALMGDACDNLPGIPGVGPTIAKRWILEYGSIPNILAHKEKLKPERLRKAVDPDLLQRNLIVTTSYDTGHDIPATKPPMNNAKDLLRELGLYKIADRI